MTYEAPDDAFVCIRDAAQLCQVRQQYGLASKYVLGIGSADPRKNIGSLIRAYGQLPSDLIGGYQLAIVLTHHRFQETLLAQAKADGIADRVRFLKLVPTVDLARIYSAASLFVFPSGKEGVWPAAAWIAMACGAPLVAANNSSLSEILGAAAQFVNDANPAGDLGEPGHKQCDGFWKARLYSGSMSQYGLARVRTFVGSLQPPETLAVYHKVIEGLRPRFAVTGARQSNSLNRRHGHVFCSSIIPTINRSTLTRAVCSVLDQQFDRAGFEEVIVVNDSGRPLPDMDWLHCEQVQVVIPPH